MSAYRIPNHDACLLAGSDCDNSAMDAAREAMTGEQLREIAVSVADEMGGSDAFYTLEAFADQVETLADAHYMLNLLFERDLTVAQAMEVTKCNTSLILALRKLRNLTAQCAKAIDEAARTKAAELADDMAERARQDADEARAA